jgi:hypothetical protein
MHKLNVLILGPNSFTSTLTELKSFLKFNSHFNISDVSYDVLICHIDSLKIKRCKDFIDNNNSIKIFTGSKKSEINNYPNHLKLPTTLIELNAIVENISVKEIFSKNSSIKINNYFLDKNEKKLFNKDEFIILTEKEIQLLELFLIQKKPITKNEILSSVWNYSSNVDTHTVETHIYRLRKKINEKFSDERFINNNKDGYYL